MVWLKKIKVLVMIKKNKVLSLFGEVSKYFIVVFFFWNFVGVCWICVCNLIWVRGLYLKGIVLREIIV